VGVVQPNVRTALASSAAWLVGAATSVGVALVALSLIGDGLSTHGVSPLTPGGSEAVAVSEIPTSSATTRSDPTKGSDPMSSTNAASPTTTPPAGQVLRSSGGFVVASCIDGEAYLVSWVPEQGYEVHDVRRGPAAEAVVEFERSQHHAHLSVTCVGGVAQAKVETGDDGPEHE
jgi:hypothetical protein